MTPGNIYNLVKFAKFNKCDLKSINIKDFLSFVIKENLYKKDNLIRHLIFDYIQYFFLKTNLSFNFKTYEKYTYFLKRISDTKRFNLDDDSIFIEFEEQILNG